MSHSMKSLLMRTGLMSAVIGIASPSALAAVVEGKVTAGGVGVEGALVEVVETGQTAATNAKGEYRISTLPAGDYTLSVTYIGAESQSATITATDDSIGQFNFSLDSAERYLDSVVVTGQRGSLFAGINQQRAAENLISVISSDAVGQFPDQNVAESVRRVAGVSVANDQGEGRFVVIRGIDPALNATSVNGVRIAAPEADTRAVALDVIDADILDSIEIVKSLTPDLDGDGIGGSINIKTLSAFDKDGLYLKGKAEAIYSESSERVTPKLSLTGSYTMMDDTLGVAGSISYNRRDFTTQNTEGDGLLDDEISGLPYFPEELEQRFYDISRERISTSLNLDYRWGANTELYLRSLYNRFEDDEVRQRVEYKFEDLEDAPAPTFNGNLVTFTSTTSDDDKFEIDRDIKNRVETQEIWSVQAGGSTRYSDNLIFDYQIAYSHSEEEEPDRVDTGFRAEFEEDALNLIVDYSDMTIPRVVGGSDELFGFNGTLSGFEFDDAELTNGLTEEEEFAAKLDITREGNAFGVPGFVKGGVKVRLRDKTFDVTTNVFDGFDGDYTLASLDIGAIDYELGQYGFNGAGGSDRDFFFANRGSFEENAFDTAAASFGERFDAQEKIYATYIMSQSDFGKALITGGLRLEVTDFKGEGFSTTAFTFEGDSSNVVGRPIDGALVAQIIDLGDDGVPGGDDDNEDKVEEVYADFQSETKNYVDLLPSINGRFDVTDTIVARAAYYASIARPSIKQATPASTLELEDGELKADPIGNPGLDRQQAHNVDLSLEWYPSSQGVLSAGVFMKEIANPIAEVVSENFTSDGFEFDEAVFFVNLEDNADIVGMEFNYQQAFDGILPGALGGLIIGANYTVIDSDTTYINEDGVGRSIPMPRMSDETGNFVVGYDKYGLDLRLALSYRSGYLDEVGSDGVDRYFSARNQLDLTAKYDIMDNLKVIGEVSNITDESEHAVFRTPVGSALSQYDEYGYTAKFGLIYTY